MQNIELIVDEKTEETKNILTSKGGIKIFFLGISAAISFLSIFLCTEVNTNTLSQTDYLKYNIEQLS